MNQNGTSLRVFSVCALVALLAAAVLTAVLLLTPLLRPDAEYSGKGQAGEFAPAEETETVRRMNEMSGAEYEEVDGIGPALSEKILTLREAAGGFRFAEDIQAVNGIGDAKYQAILDYLSP